MSKFNFTWWSKQLDNATSKEKASLRYRNFVTVVYPESAPPNWVERLNNYRVPYFISPLHDRDFNMVGSEPKKAHYHVMVMFDNKKSYQQVTEMFNDFGGVGGEIVQSPRGTARYLCHLDNPEKARYSVDDIKCGFGADYDSMCTLPTDIAAITKMMQQTIKQHDFIYFEDFADYCMENDPQMFKVLTEKRTFYIREYIYSRYKRHFSQR